MLSLGAGSSHPKLGQNF